MSSELLDEWLEDLLRFDDLEEFLEDSLDDLLEELLDDRLEELLEGYW